MAGDGGSDAATPRPDAGSDRARQHPSAPVLSGLRILAEGAVAQLVLDRPAVLNALSVELLDGLVDACRWLDTRDEVRVVVLRGAGRTFSAGADLAAIERLLANDGHARDAAAAGDRAAHAIESLRAVSLAAIRGRCVGGGIVLALACDLRVAAHTARFSIPEVDLGIPLAWGGVPRLLREVGPAVARDLILTGREFDADTAAAFGVVSRVLDDDRFDGQVVGLATELASKPPLPVRATLDGIARTLGIGAPLGWSDADTLLSAVRDPESRAAARHTIDALRTRR